MRVFTVICTSMTFHVWPTEISKRVFICVSRKPVSSIWKACFFLNPEAKTNKAQKKIFGFKSNNSPPTIEEMREFEDNMQTGQRNQVQREPKARRLPKNT